MTTYTTSDGTVIELTENPRDPRINGYLHNLNGSSKHIFHGGFKGYWESRSMGDSIEVIYLGFIDSDKIPEMRERCVDDLYDSCGKIRRDLETDLSEVERNGKRIVFGTGEIIVLFSSPVTKIEESR